MGKIITSFDIGIRNLAYCTMEYDPSRVLGDQFIIHDWDVIDLLPTEKKKYLCQSVYQSGKNKGQICNKPAYYFADNVPLCKTHSNSYQSSQLTRCYSVKNTELFELACLIVQALDKRNFDTSEEIILESQPSKNPKMKNISMLIFNYFIIQHVARKNNNERTVKNIQFVSSHNKLTVYDGPYVECHLKDQHARNKYYGKIYCQYIIRNNPKWVNYFNTFKKRDDLADSFLQGVWYLLNGYHGHVSKQNDIPQTLQVSDPSDETNDIKKPKIILKFKSNHVGKDLLNVAKNCTSTKKIHEDYYFNRLKQIKRGVKPKENQNKYTISNIKYIIDHHIFDEENGKMVDSFIFYFGDRYVELVHI